MSSGYTVQIAALRRSADAAEDAAGRLSRLEPGRALQAAEEGVPGATAVTLLTQIMTTWAGQYTAWTRSARAYAAELDACAATYQHSEDDATRDFTRLDHRVDGRPA